MKPTPPAEQETTVNFLRTEETAQIYTCDSTMITKLERLREAHPDQVSAERPDEYGMKYRLPKSWIGFRPNRNVVLNEEQKEQKRLQMLKLREELAKKKALGR